MLYEDEKDYIMRMIKEMVRVLFSLMLGKQYTQVELPRENRFLVSGKNLGDLLLENLDYENKEEVAAAVLFYEYVGRMEEGFLKENGYSLEEVYDGLIQIARNSGYGELVPGSLPEPE